MIAVVLTRKSLAVRPYCEVKGVSCTWLGLQSQGDLIKSAIMKTYLAAHIGRIIRGFAICDLFCRWILRQHLVLNLQESEFVKFLIIL